MIILEGIDRVGQSEPLRAVEAQRMCGEEGDREDERIDESLELRV